MALLRRNLNIFQIPRPVNGTPRLSTWAAPACPIRALHHERQYLRIYVSQARYVQATTAVLVLPEFLDQ